MVSAVIGCLFFCVEFSFVFVMQAFLMAIGILGKEQVYLPEWFPVNLKFALLLLILFGFFRALVNMFKNYYANKTQVYFTSIQRVNLVSYSLKNASFVSTKEAVSAFTDVTTQSGIAIYHVSIFVNTIISAAFFFLAGFKIAPIEMISGISLLAFIMLPLRSLNRRVSRSGEDLIHEWENVSETLLRGLRNNFFLKVYNQIENEIKTGKKFLIAHRDHYLDYSKVSSLVISFPLMIGVWVLAAITFISVVKIHTPPIKLVSFFYVFIRLAQVASESLSTYSCLKFNMPAVKKLYGWFLLNNKMNENKKEIFQIAKNAQVTIKVSKLSFSYNEEAPLLDNINLSVSQAGILVIKGESGKGKSTLLSLLMGLNDDYLGEILINDVSIKNKQIDLRDILGYVGPDPYLINGSIKDNLLYGAESKDIHDDAIWEALSIVELNETISALPKKLSTEIGDIAFLSTGQKQRLSIARAILRRPSLLIFDEATANLDVNTEGKIIESLKPMLEKCTTIIITHKATFDDIATQLIEL